MKKLNALFILCAAFTITVSAQSLTIQLSGSNITCYNARNGSVNLTVSGGTSPYTFQWSNGATTEDINTLPPNFYAITVTDAASNTATDGVTITEPAQIIYQFTTSDYIVNGTHYNLSSYTWHNGTISTNVSGGVAPYTYLWSNSATTANISSLDAGSYRVTITDATSCSVLSDAVALTKPDRSDWTMSGNANTNPSSQFIGTTDAQDLSFRTNNQEALRIKTNGDLKINSFTGSGNKMVVADDNGYLLSIPYKGPYLPQACPGMLSQPWLSNATGKVHNCFDNFGIATTDPQERLEVAGTIRISANNNTTNYINILHSGGNASINTAGNGSLDINCGTGQDVKICSGTASGNTEIGGNVYLSNFGGKVGIGTTTPSQKLEISHKDATGGIVLNRQFEQGVSSQKSEIKFSHNGDQKWAIGNDIDMDGTQNFFIWDSKAYTNSGATRFFINQNGNVGIGADNPSQKLEISHKDATHEIKGIAINKADDGTDSEHSEIQFNYNGDQKWAIGNDLFNDGSQNFFIWDDIAGSSNPGRVRFLIDEIGKTYIGFGLNGLPCSGCSGNYRLFVEGGIMTRDVKVTSETPFPDYIFNSDYQPMSIYELEQFIKQNKHLPGIPSANEIEKNEGYEVGDMVQRLLQKTEEQTLYIIDQQKQIDELKVQVKNLERRK